MIKRSESKWTENAKMILAKGDDDYEQLIAELWKVRKEWKSYVGFLNVSVLTENGWKWYRGANLRLAKIATDRQEFFETLEGLVLDGEDYENSQTLKDSDEQEAISIIFW